MSTSKHYSTDRGVWLTPIEGFVHDSTLEYSSAWMSFDVEWPIG